MTRKPKSNSQIANFITKLYLILQNQQNNQIITWSQCGRYFIIKNIHRLQNEILPQIYRHKNLNSFIRQLNMYDFHKIRKDHLDIICFFNIMFTRDDRQKLCQIKRKSSIKDKENKLEEVCNSISEQQSQEVKKNKIVKKVKFNLQNNNQKNNTQKSSSFINNSLRSIQNPQSNVMISSIKQTNDEIISSFRFIGSKMSIQLNNFNLQSMNNFFYSSLDQSKKQISYQQVRFLKQRQNNSEIYYETLQFLQTQNNSRSYKINQDLDDNLSIRYDEEVNQQSQMQIENQNIIYDERIGSKNIQCQFPRQEEKFNAKVNGLQFIGSLSNFMSF